MEQKFNTYSSQPKNQPNIKTSSKSALASTTSNKQILAFLSYSVESKKNALIQLGIENNYTKFHPKVQQVLKNCFGMPCTEKYLERYLDRLHNPQVFQKGPVKELACFLYTKVALKISKEALEVETRLPLYAICFNLAQKYLLDEEVHPDSVSKLLGMPKKAINEREIFILQFALEFQIKVDNISLETFSKYLSQQN